MKAIAMLIAAMLAAVIPGLTGGWDLSFVEWVNVAVLASGAANVAIVTNHYNSNTWRIAKVFSAVVATGGVVLISVFSDSVITSGEVIQIVIAVIAPIAVYFAPRDQGMMVGTGARSEPVVEG